MPVRRFYKRLMSRPTRWIVLLGCFLAVCPLSYANTLNFTGYFLFDDDVAFVSYTQPANTNAAVIRTTSFAVGGFGPILTLYDVNGFFLYSTAGEFTNDCGITGPDPATGYCYDAEIQWAATAGSVFWIAISQYDNFPIGDNPFLVNNASTFFEYGNSNFTSGAPFGPGCGQSTFCLDTGEARTGLWALEIRFTPEPAPALLFIGGMAALGGLRRFAKRI